jgi:phosphonoacetaldehyde hydrolase
MIHTILFDLAGTTIDCGCQAIRGDERLGAPPTEAELDARFVMGDPGLLACLPEHARPIPGFPRLAAELRAQGLRLGATTDHGSALVAALRPLLAEHGWVPDFLVCATDVPAGRPAPYMNQLAAIRLGAPSVSACVVVGDTPADVEAARNAGMWAVGVAQTSSEVGYGWDALMRLPAGERARVASLAERRLEAAGAHVVIDTVLDLPGALATLRRPGVAAFKRWNRQR